MVEEVQVQVREAGREGDEIGVADWIVVVVREYGLSCSGSEIR